MYAKVKDHDNLVRDMQSKAVLNTDTVGLQEYMRKREIAKLQQNEHIETKQRLAKIEEEMSEIKKLLIQMASLGSENGN